LKFGKSLFATAGTNFLIPSGFSRITLKLEERNYNTFSLFRYRIRQIYFKPQNKPAKSLHIPDNHLGICLKVWFA